MMRGTERGTFAPAIFATGHVWFVMLSGAMLGMIIIGEIAERLSKFVRRRRWIKAKGAYSPRLP